MMSTKDSSLVKLDNCTCETCTEIYYNVPPTITQTRYEIETHICNKRLTIIGTRLEFFMENFNSLDNSARILNDKVMEQTPFPSFTEFSSPLVRLANSSEEFWNLVDSDQLFTNDCKSVSEDIVYYRPLLTKIGARYKMKEYVFLRLLELATIHLFKLGHLNLHARRYFAALAYYWLANLIYDKFKFITRKAKDKGYMFLQGIITMGIVEAAYYLGLYDHLDSSCAAITSEIIKHDTLVKKSLDFNNRNGKTSLQNHVLMESPKDIARTYVQISGNTLTEYSPYFTPSLKYRSAFIQMIQALSEIQVFEENMGKEMVPDRILIANLLVYAKNLMVTYHLLMDVNAPLMANCSIEWILKISILIQKKQWEQMAITIYTDSANVRLPLSQDATEFQNFLTQLKAAEEVMTSLPGMEVNEAREVLDEFSEQINFHETNGGHNSEDPFGAILNTIRCVVFIFLQDVIHQIMLSEQKYESRRKFQFYLRQANNIALRHIDENSLGTCILFFFLNVWRNWTKNKNANVGVMAIQQYKVILKTLPVALAMKTARDKLNKDVNAGLAPNGLGKKKKKEKKKNLHKTNHTGIIAPVSPLKSRSGSASMGQKINVDDKVLIGQIEPCMESLVEDRNNVMNSDSICRVAAERTVINISPNSLPKTSQSEFVVEHQIEVKCQEKRANNDQLFHGDVEGSREEILDDRSIGNIRIIESSVSESGAGHSEPQLKFHDESHGEKTIQNVDELGEEVVYEHDCSVDNVQSVATLSEVTTEHAPVNLCEDQEQKCSEGKSTTDNFNYDYCETGPLNSNESYMITRRDEEEKIAVDLIREKLKNEKFIYRELLSCLFESLHIAIEYLDEGPDTNTLTSEETVNQCEPSQISLLKRARLLTKVFIYLEEPNLDTFVNHITEVSACLGIDAKPYIQYDVSETSIRLLRRTMETELMESHLIPKKNLIQPLKPSSIQDFVSTLKESHRYLEQLQHKNELRKGNGKQIGESNSLAHMTGISRGLVQYSRSNEVFMATRVLFRCKKVADANGVVDCITDVYNCMHLKPNHFNDHQ